MNQLSYRLLNSSDFITFHPEHLRQDAYSSTEKFSDFYLKKIKEGYLLAFGCFYQNQLVGCAYLSNYLNSLYIEQLFVKKEYQNHPLHIGYHLLEYILVNKKIFEDYFNEIFEYSRLESRGHDSFYQALGYRQENNLLETMKKRI